MKKSIKKLLTVGLSASMLLGSLPATVYAEPSVGVEDQTEETIPEVPEADVETVEETVPEVPETEEAAEEEITEEEVMEDDSMESPEALTERAFNADEIKELIWDAIFKGKGEALVDLSTYGLNRTQVMALTDEVLEEKNASSAATATCSTDEEGNVTVVNVEMDASTAYALEEIETLAEESGEGDNEDIQQKVFEDYMKLQDFYRSQPDFFGLATPYFTSKDTEMGPVTALLSLLQQTIPQEGEDTPAPPDMEIVDQIIVGYTQTLQMCVRYLGADLMAARDQALRQIDSSMSREEKFLVINDWLGNFCNFDMAEIMNQNQPQEKEEVDTAIATAVALADGDQQPPSEEEIRYMLLYGDLASFVKSTAFGALVRKDCLCIGYSAAYTYLIQCAFPEIYKDGEGNWKTADLVNNGQKAVEAVPDDPETPDIDESQPAVEGVDPTYMVDFIKIFWNSNVTMLGEPNQFRNSHYFNAVNMGDQNKWYYVDSCYNDIYVECMGRNRVETDGNMVHSYFMVSHTTLAKQFDGNYDQIETLYETKATDTTYEEAWFSKACGPIQYDKENWYYVKNTSEFSGAGITEGSDQLVTRPRNSKVLDGSDEKMLIDYTDGSGAVKSGADLVKEGAKKDAEVNSDIYSSISHVAAYYNGALYLNVDNKILKYDLATDAITLVKEYNKVSVTQDTNKQFTGMSYSVVPEGTEGIVHTIKNHPLAAICIKDDGKLYASIATNYCHVSDYAYEETNYNSAYMNFKMGNIEHKKGGNNDNQEFQWSANFVETLDMSHIAGTNHTYKTVTVAPTCGMDGYTEERCTACGAVKPGAERTINEKTALEHSYMMFKDTTYTKDSKGERIIVDAGVCPECLDALDHEKDSDKLIIPEGTKTGHVYGEPTFKWAEDNSTCTATFVCTACDGAELDFLVGDEEITKTVDCEITNKNADGFDCSKGGQVIYTATCKFEEKEYSKEKPVEVPAGDHNYGEPTFTWADDNTCTATYKCNKCNAEVKDEKCEVTPVVTDPTCTEAGKTVYTATVSVKGENPKDYSDEKEVEIPALGHAYAETPEYKWNEKDHSVCTAEFGCTRTDCDHVEKVECTVKEEVVKEGSCTEDATIKYTATCTFNEKEYTSEPKEVTIKAEGHKYNEPTFTWTISNDEWICIAEFECSVCKHTQREICDVTESEDKKDPTCAEDGYRKYDAVCNVPGFECKDTKTEKIPAYGHKYDENDICENCGQKRPEVSQPILVSAKNTSAGVTVTWEKADGADDYRVYRKVPGGSWKRIADNVTTTSYTDTTAKSGTDYIYTVRGLAGKQISTYDKTGKAVRCLAQPEITKLINVTSGMVLNWDKVPGVTGYTVYRKADGSNKWVKLRSTGSTSLGDKTTEQGVTYNYTVKSYYKDSKGNITSSSYDTTGATLHRIKTTSIYEIKNIKGGKLNVKWKTEDIDASGYLVEYADNSSFKNSKVIDEKNPEKYYRTISKLEIGKTYYVRITSYKDVDGERYYSGKCSKNSVTITK